MQFSNPTLTTPLPPRGITICPAVPNRSQGPSEPYGTSPTDMLQDRFHRFMAVLHPPPMIPQPPVLLPPPPVLLPPPPVLLPPPPVLLPPPPVLLPPPPVLL